MNRGAMTTYTCTTERPGATSPITVTLPPIADRLSNRVLLAARWLRCGVHLTPAIAYAVALWNNDSEALS